MTSPQTAPIDALIEVMRCLRDPDGGCPWDIEQTFETIAPYTIEEAYEVADAIAQGSRTDLRDELGDLLLQVVYHSRMAEEEGAFAFNDVASAITEKMIRRHPHVFGDDTVDSADAQTERWEATKAAERAKLGDNASALDGVALALPALVRAQKLQKRAARVGFDWPDASGVTDKIAEEATELAEEIAANTSQDRVAEEYGDLLFSVAILGQHLGVDAEQALVAANRKFDRRFRQVEAALAERGKSPSESTLEEMDGLWDAVKRNEKTGS